MDCVGVPDPVAVFELDGMLSVTLPEEDVESVGDSDPVAVTEL